MNLYSIIILQNITTTQTAENIPVYGSVNSNDLTLMHGGSMSYTEEGLDMRVLYTNEYTSVICE